MIENFSSFMNQSIHEENLNDNSGEANIPEESDRG
jgi:hypothetical protein